MGEVFRTAEDPHWDLILAIAESLLVDGEYSAEVDSPALQYLIDLRWSAHEVGRIFRISTEVEVRASTADDDQTLTVTITRRDGAARTAADRRAGLDALLRAVDRSHLRPVPSDQPSIDDQ